MKRLMGVFVLLLAAASQGMTARPAFAVDSALSAAANAAFLANYAKQKGVIVRPDGLEFKIIQNGFGDHPLPTDTVTVYYTGELINGTIFDGTSPGLPASFQVNSVIPGWIEAMQTMRVGDHWQIVIPPNLAYGDRGTSNGIIPPGQVLVFDVHLIATKPAPKKGDPDYVPDKNDEDDDNSGGGQ